MRARIIFRGLTLFTFHKSSRGKSSDANPEDNNLGTLTALLVTDPMHEHVARHAHQPYLGFIGRDCEPPYAARAETKRRIREDLRIELKNHDDVVDGIIPEGSFLDYVPCLRDLQPDDSPALNNKYISRRIIIPHGRIRARDFITWDSWGNTPTPVSYMDTDFVGFASNEVVVEMGDDSDFELAVHDKCLSISSANNPAMEYECLWPRVAAPNFTALDEDVESNMVEVLITNLPARRRRPVFWSKHFQTLFDAAGYPRRPTYADTDQYDQLEARAMDYDSYEWGQDAPLDSLERVPGRQPFPYLDFAGGFRFPGLTAIAEPEIVETFTAGAEPEIVETLTVGVEPKIVETPPTHGRPKDDAIPGVAMPGAMVAGRGQQMDPQNSQICPFGRE